MSWRTLVFFTLLTLRCCGQADTRYDVQDQVTTGDLDYTIERDCTVYCWSGPPDLQYAVDVTVWGCRRKSYSYNTEWYETQLTPPQYAELQRIVKSVDLSKLNRNKTTCLMGMLAINGQYHFFNNALGEPVRDYLQQALLAWLQNVAPPEKRKITRHTIEGDFQPCRSVTLAQLLDDPAKYDGKRVRVSGYYHHEEYESSFSQKPGDDFKSSLWLDDPSSFAHDADIHWTDDGHLALEGTFSKGPGGRWGVYAGEIQRLTRVTCLDPPRPPPPPADQSSKH
jgi:hypothetical protein